MGAWKNALFLQENLHVHQIPPFRGGGVFWVFFGGECRFYFYGREDFSECSPLPRFAPQGYIRQNHLLQKPTFCFLSIHREGFMLLVTITYRRREPQDQLSCDCASTWLPDCNLVTLLTAMFLHLLGAHQRGSCNRTLLRRVLRRFFKGSAS